MRSWRRVPEDPEPLLLGGRSKLSDSGFDGNTSAVMAGTSPRMTKRSISRRPFMLAWPLRPT